MQKILQQDFIMRILNNAGSILKLENEGSGLALIAHSHSGSSTIIDGNTVKTNQVLDVFNLGTGRTMTVNQANPNSDQNTVTVSSATTAAVMSLESTRNGNQSPNNALLELKMGYIKVPQNNEFEQLSFIQAVLIILQEMLLFYIIQMRNPQT